MGTKTKGSEKKPKGKAKHPKVKDKDEPDEDDDSPDQGDRDMTRKNGGVDSADTTDASSAAAAQTSAPLSNDDDNDEPDDDANLDDAVTTKKKRIRKRKRKGATSNDTTESNDKSTSNSIDAAVAASTFSIVATDDDTAKKTAQVDRTMYIEGLPFAATPAEVRQFIVENYVATAAAATTTLDADQVEDLRLPVWQDSGRLRGYGHVVFATLNAYEYALQKAQSAQKCYLHNRYITVQPAKTPNVGGGSSKSDATNTTTQSSSEPSATITLHNLSYAATEEDIQAALTEYYAVATKAAASAATAGTTLDIAPGGVRVVRHSGTMQSKGFAYVTLGDIEQAVAIVTHNNSNGNNNTPLSILGRPCRMDYDHGRIKGSYRTADRTLWNKEYGQAAATTSSHHVTDKRQKR